MLDLNILTKELNCLVSLQYFTGQPSKVVPLCFSCFLGLLKSQFQSIVLIRPIRILHTEVVSYLVRVVTSR